jgi:predicted MFS family arabinose efflux permease
VVVDALDEASSGLPSSGAFAVQSSFGASVSSLNAAVFAVPVLVALLVEAPLLLWCERFERQRTLAFGLGSMAVGCLGCALARDVYLFSAGVCVCYTASGIACGVAQSVLMDADPERRELRMTQWATAGWVGDLASPLLLWASAALGWGWRGSYAMMAACLLLAAALFARTPLPGGVSETDEQAAPSLEQPSLEQTVRQLLRSSALLWWLVGVALCSLLDEIVAELLGMRIREAGGDTAVVSRALLAFTLGGLLGLLVLERLLKRVVGLSLLVSSCIGCTVVMVVWLLSGSLAWAVPLLFLTGLFAAAHYPLAQAQAYAAVPGRSVLVAAAGQPLLLLDLAFPLGMGALADWYGLTVALAVTLLQPVGLLVVVALTRRSRSSSGSR